MDKSFFIQKLNSIELPIGEYYILSSGSLLLYGLREEANDIDLCVSKELFENTLKEKYKLDDTDKNEYGFYKIAEDVEVVVNEWEKFLRKFVSNIFGGNVLTELAL